MADQHTSYPREEVEAAFAEFRRRGIETHDWAGWADLFTDDALYEEHYLGTMHGRDDIKTWIVKTMQEYPSMTLWIDWAVIDDDLVGFYIWNNLPDPAGGDAPQQFANTTMLRYAGDGKWSWEADFYNPADAMKAWTAWFEAGGRRDTPPNRALEGIADWAPAPSETPHPREEVERELEAYMARSALAKETGDWDQWADQFTEDARYLEHHYGRMSGRAEIKAWISEVMVGFPEMYFPRGATIIDGNVVMMVVPNLLPDPTGGDQVYGFDVNVILHYAGNGQWSYEEDVYSMEEAAAVIGAWLKAGGSRVAAD